MQNKVTIMQITFDRNQIGELLIAMNQAVNEGRRKLGDVAGAHNQGDTCLPENELGLLEMAISLINIKLDDAFGDQVATDTNVMEA
jgi:hypothetical protein